MKSNANQEKLEGKLVKSFEVKGLGDLAAEYAELGLDSLLDEGVAKSIPIVNTVVALCKVGANVRDRIYLKKLLCFFIQAGDTTHEEREVFLEKYCKDFQRFEETIMLILEQADRVEKSTLIGKIFKACILGKIALEDSFALSSMVNKALWQDLQAMFDGSYIAETEIQARLANTGLQTAGSAFGTLAYNNNRYTNLLIEIAKME